MKYFGYICTFVLLYTLARCMAMSAQPPFNQVDVSICLGMLLIFVMFLIALINESIN